MQSLDQDPGRRREHREQAAQDQADSRGRNEEAAIRRQAKISLGDRGRIERDPRRVVGLAEHRAIGYRTDNGKDPDKDDFGTPSKRKIYRPPPTSLKSRPLHPPDQPQ